MLLLMVIDNLHVRGAERFVGPAKTNPLLVIDADVALAFSSASQRFKPVPGQCTKVFKQGGRLEPVQLQTGRTFDSGERFHPLTGSEVPGSPVPEADDRD